MFKISKLTDYSVVLLRYLKAFEGPASARDLAKLSGLPLPTVSKLLKILSKNKIIRATRGVSGGYEILIDPAQISVLKLIELFEGSKAITACLSEHAHCQIENSCPQKNSWHEVDQKISQILSSMSVGELIGAK